MRTILVCGAGPSYGATLDCPHERWAVNWRGGEPKPVLNVTGDHNYPVVFKAALGDVPLRHISTDEYPFMRIQNTKCKLGFSGPLAVWWAFEQGAERVVLTGTELSCEDGHASALYRLQIPCWAALAETYRGRFWLHPASAGGLTGAVKIFPQDSGLGCR